MRHLRNGHGTFAAGSDTSTRHEHVLPGLEDVTSSVLGRDLHVLLSAFAQEVYFRTM